MTTQPIGDNTTMPEIPANAAPVIDHPTLPAVAPIPTPLPPSTWPEQQQAATDAQAVQL